LAAAKFITLEGGEGGGKTTQAKRLVEALAGAGIGAIATREPGGAPGAEEIRSLLVSGAPGRWEPLTEALLHFSARREHLRSTIQPALTAGTWVVCDRFTDSTMAYQGYAQGLGRDTVERLESLVQGGRRPDLTLILDLPVDAGLAREQQRGGSDRYARMGAEFHGRVRDAFRDIARREPRRCALIDATRSIDEVAAAIWAQVRGRLLA
jgi:dTMP kinase